MVGLCSLNLLLVNYPFFPFIVTARICIFWYVKDVGMFLRKVLTDCCCFPQFPSRLFYAYLPSYIHTLGYYLNTTEVRNLRGKRRFKLTNGTAQSDIIPSIELETPLTTPFLVFAGRIHPYAHWRQSRLTRLGKYSFSAMI